MEKKLTTFLDVPQGGVEVLEQLWPTPILMSKPFDDDFLKELRKDVKQFLVPGGVGTLNQTDLWKLPNLPETMLAVKTKMYELAEKAFRPNCEQPIKSFHPGKAYFREVKPSSPYKIIPHRHASAYGIGIFYITASNRNPGNLTFLDPRAGINWTNQFTAFKKITVEEGLMIIHPGYLIHFVEPTDPKMGMFYDYRLALVSHIHRDWDEWTEALAEHDKDIMRMGMEDI
jgi:hypothetical protein